MLEYVYLYQVSDLWSTYYLVVFAIALIVISELSSRLVERPIWRMNTSHKLSLIILGIGILPSTAIFISLHETGGFRKYFAEHLSSQELKNFIAIEKYATPDHLKNPVSAKCNVLNDFSSDFVHVILECSSQRKTLLIVGDSHAINIYNGIARNSDINKNFNVIAIASGGCAIGNKVRNCDINAIQKFITSNSSRFHRIIYTEAGFRQFKNIHGEQSERRDFMSEISIRNLKPDSEKIELILDWLKGTGDLGRIIWVGPWPEPQIYLNGTNAIKHLADMDNHATHSAYEKLSDIYINIAQKNGQDFVYIDLLQFLINTESKIFTNGCLRFSDKDHLSTCGEDYIAEKIVTNILSN
jgi:hypothetical protein